MREISWDYSEPINDSLINEYENRYDIQLPPVFKSIACQNNYGYPKPSKINVGGRVVSVKCLLSFKKTDEESVWNYTDLFVEQGVKGYPMAIDNFGNIFFFESNDFSISFLDLETDSRKSVTESFEAFVDQLF